MKNIDILNLSLNLSNIDLKGVKISYAIARNIAILKPEAEALLKAKEPSNDFKVYDNERVEIAKKYAKKDENGEPVIKDDTYVFDNKEAFDKEVAKLQKLHAKAIEEREKQINDFKDLLEKETPIELHKVNITDIPEDITSQQMLAIYQIIEDEQTN